MFENFLAKLAGKWLSNKLKLEDGPMDTKKWYQSKTVWAGVVAVLVSLYNAVGSNLAPALGHALPAIPDWIFTLLGALGIYGRVTADTKIG